MAAHFSKINATLLLRSERKKVVNQSRKKFPFAIALGYLFPATLS